MLMAYDAITSDCSQDIYVYKYKRGVYDVRAGWSGVHALMPSGIHALLDSMGEL